MIFRSDTGITFSTVNRNLCHMHVCKEEFLIDLETEFTIMMVEKTSNRHIKENI